MNKFKTIESWASSLGYVVELDSNGYVWHKDSYTGRGRTTQDVVEQILSNIKSSYEGGE